MEKPSVQFNLRPGNKKTKSKRSLPKARRIGKNRDLIIHTLKDPRVGEFPILNSANGWWAKMPEGIVKIQKLIDGYCFYFTDREACSYAGITETQLNYFQVLHPDFYRIKAIAKSQPDINAKVTIIKKLTEDVNVATWWISRTQKETFSPKLNIATQDEEERHQVHELTENIKMIGEQLRGEIKIQNANNTTTEEYSSGESEGGTVAEQEGYRDEAETPELDNSFDEAIPVVPR